MPNAAESIGFAAYFFGIEFDSHWNIFKNIVKKKMSQNSRNVNNHMYYHDMLLQ